MTKIYEVRSIARSDEKTHHWGACQSREQAEQRLAARTTGAQEEWARKYHARWWIEEIDTSGLFQVPSHPAPRERFSTRATVVETPKGYTNELDITVLDEHGETVARYHRTHSSLYRTFEPFRQGDRYFALFSSDYTATSVMDLATGEVIASEEPNPAGFCPVGFYVPDWWDIHDGSILPGSGNWNESYELPRGDFGFVWGCIWGDDSSWKVQYLDLSRIQQGTLIRDERFGYVELASNPKLSPKDFIHCYFDNGTPKVEFAVLASFDVSTGKKLG